jgi:hypothetical protein
MSNLKVTFKPMSRELRHFLQRARFLEQVSCAGNNLHFLLARKPRKRFVIEADNGIRLDLPFKFGGGNQRRSRPSTRAEKAEFEICDIVSVGCPSRRFNEPACEHPDVEPKMACEILLLLFTRREQVKQQRRDAGFLQNARDVLVARTSPAAAAPVRKQHKPMRIPGHGKFAVEIRSPHWNCDCFWLLHLPITNLQRAPAECNPQAEPSRQALTLEAR